MSYSTDSEPRWSEHATRRASVGREQAQELEWFRWLADAVAALHAGYLIYLVVGGYVAWWLRKTFPLHALAVAWALTVVTTPLPCPLTSLQNSLRAKGGEPYLPGTFQQTYLHDVVYPARSQTSVYIMVAIVVTTSWVVAAMLAVTRARRTHPSPVTTRRARSARSAPSAGTPRREVRQ